MLFVNLPVSLSVNFHSANRQCRHLPGSLSQMSKMSSELVSLSVIFSQSLNVSQSDSVSVRHSVSVSVIVSVHH